jgi:hypothetical protein
MDMVRILGLEKEDCTDPPVFTVFLLDEEKARKGYLWSTQTGTEKEIRKTLAAWPDPFVDRLFTTA